MFFLESLKFLNCLETFRFVLDSLNFLEKNNYFKKILRTNKFFSHSRMFLDKKKGTGISWNLFIISSEFRLFANLPDYLKAVRSIKKKTMDILR